MRTFTDIIFDDIIRGTTEVFTSPKFNDLLGRADDLVFEIVVMDSTGGSPTITVRYHHSCSNEGTFTALADLITNGNIATPPYQKVVQQAGPLGAYGKLGITLGGSTPTARVRVYVTGRGTGRG